MNGLLKYSFPICFSLLALFACEDDGIDVDNIEVPAGFALSAGTATNFLTSSYAYDRSADGNSIDNALRTATVFFRR